MSRNFYTESKSVINYYAVTVKCGHVGQRFFVVKTLPTQAKNGKEAAKLARQIPRVKHDRADAILSVQKISASEYWNLQDCVADDIYFHVNNKQDQTRLLPDLLSQVEEEPVLKSWKHIAREPSRHLIYDAKIKIRNVRNYYRLYKGGIDDCV